MNLLMSTNVLNYQAELIVIFSKFLHREGTSVKTQKNYGTDLHHFLNWTLLTIKNTHGITPQNHVTLLSLVTTDLIEAYKLYLQHHHVPHATINRRLSALRIFFRCCIAEGWIEDNPAARVANITQSPNFSTPAERIVSYWKTHLRKTGTPPATIKRYADDVTEFLRWMENKA